MKLQDERAEAAGRSPTGADRYLAYLNQALDLAGVEGMHAVVENGVLGLQTDDLMASEIVNRLLNGLLFLYVTSLVQPRPAPA